MKYKLVKEYPNGPKLNNIYESSDTEYYINGSKTLHKEFIENYPEFWEKVVEKDYLIIGYYQKPDNIHINITGNFSKTFEKEYNIYQVKRLSNGEVFTVGDNTTSGIITQIQLDNIKGLWLDFKHGGGYHGGYDKDNNYKNLKKVKQPIFQTEDGIDIFEGDKYWIAHDDKYGCNALKWQINNTPYLCENIIPTKRDELAKYGSYRLSTKEKAEEFILLNKPVLSLNDIMKLSKPYHCGTIKRKKVSQNTFKFTSKNLKDLIKSKIQQSV